MESLNLSFRYSESDYVRAMRAHYISRLRLPLDIAVLVGAAVLGAYELRAGQNTDSAMAEADRAMYEKKRARR